MCRTHPRPSSVVDEVPPGVGCPPRGGRHGWTSDSTIWGPPVRSVHHPSPPSPGLTALDPSSSRVLQHGNVAEGGEVEVQGLWVLYRPASSSRVPSLDRCGPSEIRTRGPFGGGTDRGVGGLSFTPRVDPRPPQPIDRCQCSKSLPTYRLPTAVSGWATGTHDTNHRLTGSDWEVRRLTSRPTQGRDSLHAPVNRHTRPWSPTRRVPNVP